MKYDFNVNQNYSETDLTSMCANHQTCEGIKTRSSRLNLALRDDEAVYWVRIGHYEAVIDDTGSVEGMYAFIYCTKRRSGQVLPVPYSFTH